MFSDEVREYSHVLYGLGTEIECSGNDFWAHKTGFKRSAGC
jgi:hypothetical protein